MTAQEYIEDELAANRLTAAHIQALTLYYQAAHITLGARDGMPGPQTRAALEARYPGVFAPPVKAPGRFLGLPLAIIRGAHGARRPVVTSSFRPADRPDHNGCDWFYRWQDGDQPNFVGDGGCEGKLADGTPKWVVPYGTEALAAAAGTVQIAGNSPTGYRVWVNHGNGLRSGYFHLERIYCQAGAKVLAGTALGLIGHNPSPAKDGRHLHFEVSPVEKYEPLDPQKYLKEGV